MLTSLSFGEIIMDGASTFFRVLKCMRGQTSARQKTDVLWNNLQLSQHSKCVLFFTEKHVQPIRKHFRIISMLQKYKNNSLSVRTIFPVPANMHFEGTLESFWTKPHLEINIVYARSVGEIFPPYTLYTRTRGRPF